VQVLLLVKPQFEVGHRDASRGMGVVRDPTLWRQSIVEVIESYRNVGLHCCAVVPSRLRGAQGNQEFFVLFRRSRTPDDLDPLFPVAIIDDAVLRARTPLNDQP
jgi:23S rRNA (cytidine1920-2'-O)/16S rRNA (cytidine1409-2'-O)-methyltransferase